MKKIVLILAISLLLFSCKTYLITPESLKQQLESTNKSGHKDVTINNPFGGTINYEANSLEVVTVLSKKGETVVLANSPALETRVTLKNGKRYIMYFDTLTLKDGILTGSRAKLFKIEDRKIPFDSIVKIEIQDGGKNYSYQ